MATTFDAFLEQAWADHADRPAEVAQRLDQGYALIETPAQIAPLARILAHVDGEHLARWADGVARLERLRAHAQWHDDGEGAVVVRRLVAALTLGGGDEPASPMSAADRAQAHAVAASALAAQGRRGDAIRHFRTALSAAAPGIADGDPAVRALAVTSNNLAATLEELPSRDAEETASMLDAARAAREYWARAGGWLEIERAEYMLAKCHLAASYASATARRHSSSSSRKACSRWRIAQAATVSHSRWRSPPPSRCMRHSQRTSSAGASRHSSFLPEPRPYP